MLRDTTLDDKYELLEGRLLLSGVQALTRLPIIQQQLDRSAGRRTGGFISGYQGSPITSFDLSLTRERKRLAAHDIVFQPGVNEELAATSCWGSQQLSNFSPGGFDGVFALWYGKGPGVDRASDAIKHGNHAGTHPLGGVIAAFGDDHAAKSSTVAHNSEPAMAAMSVPVLYPAGVAEIIPFGLMGWAMSRYSGLWSGLKLVNDTIEQTATVDLDLRHSSVVVPVGGQFPPEGVHYNSNYTPARDDVIVTRYKLPLIHLFARANGIDRSVGVAGAPRRLGIVAAGKSFNDVRQALRLLRIDDRRTAALGIHIYKPGLVWPLEPTSLRNFARGMEQILIVEEKKPFLEPQVASILYSQPDRPRLIGKRDEEGLEVFPSDVPLDAVVIALVIGQRLQQLGVLDDDLTRALLDVSRRIEQRAGAPAPYSRTAFYCSGCPHNSSTRLPTGSQGMGGIGCHGMATFTRTDTLGVTQMGGEGATWIGAAPFVGTKHVFQNLGDGTYFHSGLLAVRAAVAAKLNITYKILYNDATAMTGGQPIAGPISVGNISQQLLAEGVGRVVVVTDRPELYTQTSGLAKGVAVEHRDRLDAIQRELREVLGVTAIVYEQTCAAEKRRRRKRGEFPDPPKRMLINEAVCEGCGDCAVQSNCMSLFPVDTALGRKRSVDQSTCNKDYSCVKGFCPSFVTVHGGQLRRPKTDMLDESIFAKLPDAPRAIADSAIMVAGIGGTGVVTVGAVLAMAAHLEGLYASSYDMTGMAQKGGAVYSHIRIGTVEGDIAAQKISTAEADLLIGCDLVASTAGDAFLSLRSGHTRIVANTAVMPTAEIQRNVDATISPEILKRRLLVASGADAVFVDATGAALALLGDTIGGNLLLVGVACQSGALPVSAAAIERAILLNGAAVKLNLTAFRLGRLSVHDRVAFDELQQSTRPPAAAIPTTLSEIYAHRVALLTDYQNAAYARRYSDLVNLAVRAEGKISNGEAFAIAVASGFAKLLAYKDEYEVARLYSAPGFRTALESQFEGSYRLAVNLAPPLFSRRDPLTGLPRKREYGRWIFSLFPLLARMKAFRGTAFDLFGYTTERRREREWIDRYETLIKDVAAGLTAHNTELAVEIAQIPSRIRGFGHVKERHWEDAERHLAELMARWNAPVRVLQAVEAA